MIWYLNFVVFLFVGISYAKAGHLNNYDIGRDNVNVDNIFNENLTPNNVTVNNNIDANKTMTDTLGQGRELSEGRTFAIRRLQLILLPLMYKFGVISTLVVLLFGISLKILLITMILLFIKVSSIVAKFHHHDIPHHEITWSPPPAPLPIHLHLHHDEVHDPHEEHHVHRDNHHDVHDVHDKHVHEMVYSGWEYPPSNNPYEKTIAMDKLGRYVTSYKG